MKTSLWRMTSEKKVSAPRIVCSGLFQKFSALVIITFLQLAALLLLSPYTSPQIYAGGLSDKAGKTDREKEWVYMPAGAKPAYMGIHGGTMPISLLVNPDGSALLSFVGKTGNDFLNALTNSTFTVPSFGNSTLPQKNISKTELSAGNSTASLPVFSTSGVTEEWLSHLAPFGFSVSPLAIEGQPDFPPVSAKTRRYRNFYLPGSLQISKK